MASAAVLQRRVPRLPEPIGNQRLVGIAVARRACATARDPCSSLACSATAKLLSPRPRSARAGRSDRARFHVSTRIRHRPRSILPTPTPPPASGGLDGACASTAASVEAPSLAGDVETRPADGLAQGADRRAQVVSIQDQPMPDQVEQLVSAGLPVTPFDQRHQHVEGARSPRCRAAIDQQPSLGWPDLEVTGLVGSHQWVPRCAEARPLYARNLDSERHSGPSALNSGGSRTEKGSAESPLRQQRTPVHT